MIRQPFCGNSGWSVGLQVQCFTSGGGGGGFRKSGVPCSGPFFQGYSAFVVGYKRRSEFWETRVLA